MNNRDITKSVKMQKSSTIKCDRVFLGKSFVVSSQNYVDIERENREKELEYAKNEAQLIIQKAKNEADQIIEKAKNEAIEKSEEIIEQYRREGFDEGLKLGRIEIERECEDKIRGLEDFVKVQFEIKNRLLKCSHREVLDLVLLICEKICGLSIKFNEGALESLIERAIGEIENKSQEVRIIVDPQLYERVISISDKIKENICILEHIEVVQDSSVGVDGVIVMSNGMKVDASVRSQIDELSLRLFETMDRLDVSKFVEISLDTKSADGEL